MNTINGRQGQAWNELISSESVHLVDDGIIFKIILTINSD